ncbi:MAG TPA: hypothetical protein PLD20_13830 [Blastocatellia bacterium]|nr:hypothetical protein [Blastocatellia bacterium]HMX25897.1 hypothetical protein [Blastocatellia bacterium]HMZ19011.1 hypothetical protein [Blastocatellia bacterium]HNG28301.1 hypothetical protein [Blastocatellia bacterium]
MKFKSFPQIPLAPAFLSCFLLAAPIFATQISFVPSPPPRNLQAQQQQGQPSKGLPAEKKKSLAKFGPEDAFPGAHEQEQKNKASKRQPTTRSTPAPQPTLTDSSSPTPTPAPAVPQTASIPTPTATQPALAAALQQNPPAAGTASTSSLVPIVLSVAALLLFSALLYVIGMLRKKLREGN